MKFLFISLVSAVVFLTGCSTPEKAISTQEKRPLPSLDRDYADVSVMVQMMDILRNHYVDADKVSSGKMFEAALHGIASNLDPYSGYEPPRTHKESSNRRNGELSGIGVIIAKPAKNNLLVVNVIPDSPADKAKIKPGDAVVAIDGKNLKQLNLYQCQKLLQGSSGTKVSLTLFSSGKTVKKTLIRRKVIMPSVKNALVINKDIGYIKISSFTLHSAGEFKKALAKLKQKNIRSLIIDLRNNTGGHVQSTVDTISQLLAPGKVIMTAHGRNPEKKQIVRSKKIANLTAETKLPVVILVNFFTASSAEIFSSALRDNKRAQLVGTRTFGKGTLLHVIRLANGGALRYSSGRYITPSGKFIEGKGLQPDHKVLIPADQLFRLTAQQRKYPGVIKPAIKNAVKDTQLEKAVNLLSSNKDAKTIKKSPAHESAAL
jgi:carboxyl-terminal processing protease